MSSWKVGTFDLELVFVNLSAHRIVGLNFTGSQAHPLTGCFWLTGAFHITRSSTAAVFSLRSRCRSSVCTQNLRKSAKRDFGHGSPANVSTGARNISVAILRDSGDISLDAIRLSLIQTKPSAAACHHARSPFSATPQAMHAFSSGKNPISRVIHRSKYVSGIHTEPAVICGSTLAVSRYAGSLTSLSGKSSSNTSATCSSAAARAQSTADISGELSTSHESSRARSTPALSCHHARTIVSGSSAPPKRRLLFMADFATPRTLPSVRVNNVTSRSASRIG